MATLQEVAEWWRERENFVLKLNPKTGTDYEVEAVCSERATVLIRDCEVSTQTAAWSHGYRVVGSRDFMLKSSVKPVVGISPNSSISAINFLKSEGFIVEQSNMPQNYGIYLDGLENFRDTDEKAICEKIENSNAPLIRYWRWPESARSVLSITGDIDSITLVDFGLRIIENFIQSLKTGRKQHK
jgi:hypothetical protein